MLLEVLYQKGLKSIGLASKCSFKGATYFHIRNFPAYQDIFAGSCWKLFKVAQLCLLSFDIRDISEMIFKLDIMLTTFLSHSLFSAWSKWEFNHLVPIKKNPIEWFSHGIVRQSFCYTLPWALGSRAAWSCAPVTHLVHTPAVSKMFGWQNHLWHRSFCPSSWQHPQPAAVARGPDGYSVLRSYRSGTKGTRMIQKMPRRTPHPICGTASFQKTLFKI